MDLKMMMDAGSGAGPWTEERHSSFLNWMEDSFVRRMFAGTDLQASCSPADNCRHPPLDRYLPDSATESTRDFHGPRPRSVAGRPMRSPALVDEEEQPETRHSAVRRTRKRALPGYDASQDQHGSAEVDDSNSKRNQREEGWCLAVSPTSQSGGRKKERMA
ncbi:uncharacterized protein LOC103707698 isoform X2 [Phoenix dactylifera]|uniref:Uncharacterized protein LOC103707698 isoform X2 n=1 Tax=Phoenix dactylifera TaxID=42345 RepID=A0A8B7C2U3_PHODC|nr:uncharacterized protein LOC103707698 isoform X2 [Phoenix dactylifera]